MRDQFGHVETDATRAQDGHALPDRLSAQDGVDVGHHLGVVDAVDGRAARLDAGGHHHLVETLGAQQGRVDACVQPQRDAQHVDPAAVVAQRLVELFLARDALGQVELAPDLAAGVEQRDLVAALRRHRGRGQPGGAGADHRDALAHGHRPVVQQGLVAGARVDQAADLLATAEGVVQAGLVAGDAGVDLVLAPLCGLVHQLGVGQHRARHRHQVGIAARQHGLGHRRHVDAVAGDHRHAQVLAQPARDLRERGTWHHGSDGRHRRFVPAEVGADDGGAVGLHGLGQRHHLVPRQSAVQHVHRGNAEDDDEVGPDGGAHALHHLAREAHAVVPRAAPAVVAQVGLLDQKGADQVAARADDLHAVVAGQTGHCGALRKVGDLLLDAGFIQFVRCVAADARLHRRRRHAVRRAGQRPHVQDLQADLHVGVGRVHGGGDLPVLLGLGRRGQLAADAGLFVGGDAASDDHAHAAARAFGVVRGHAFEAVGCFFQPGVHRAHQDAVLQPREAQVQGREDMRVAGGAGHGRRAE
jgi:hypothetical protein